MDFLTRRAAAAAGHRGALLRAAHPRYSRLSALGVRVERDRVTRAEIAQALSDLNISIELPSSVSIEAEKVEAALARYEPEQLRRAIDAFLDELAATGSKAARLAPPEGYTSWLAYVVATLDDRSLQNDYDAGLQPQWPVGVTREQIRSAAKAELEEIQLVLEETKNRRKLYDTLFDQVDRAGLYECSAGYTGDPHSAIPPDVLKAALDVFTTVEAVREWLDTPAGTWANRQTPQALIDAGREGDVIGALKGLAYGNYL